MNDTIIDIPKNNNKSIETLVSFIRHVNVAEEIDEDILNDIGREVVEGFNEDWDSMEDWRDDVDHGQELVKQEHRSKSDPYEGSANFKSPILKQAILKFGDRASTELLRGKNIVKVAVIGKDPESKKADRADRVRDMMNYQVVFEQKHWIDDHIKLLYEIPASGCAFKKTFFDSVAGINQSTLIQYPNFAINQSIVSMENAERFTEILSFTESEVISRQRSEVWLDIDLNVTNDDELTDPKEEGSESRFLEQHCFHDLDDDGYPEPYIITVHESTQKVVRIVARFEEKNIFVRDKGGRRAKISDLLDDDGELLIGGTRQVIFIESEMSITKYGFLPSDDGKFLDQGYYHLLGALTGGVNKITNDLINSGTLANRQGGFTPKNFRKKKGPLSVKQGELVQTDMTAQEMSGIVLFPFKEPSATLVRLVEIMTANAQELSASADLSSAIGANAPAATTLALVQEQQLASSAIIIRIHRSMGREFQKLAKLNADFMDPEQYQRILDDPEADFEADFNSEDLDIQAASNPELSSKIQRIQLSEAQMGGLPAVKEAGGNIQPIVKAFYENIGSDIVEEIFPTLTKEEIEEQKQIQQEAEEDAKRLEEINLDHQERVVATEELKAASTANKSVSEIKKNDATIVKTLEEAETEQTKNLSDQYTQALQLDKTALEIDQLRRGDIDGKA